MNRSPVICMALLMLLAGSTSVAFAQQESVNDTLQGEALKSVVVTASRTRESFMRAPASVQKAGRSFFQSSGAPSFFDALENLKGVQMITPSIGFRILNTRGFANTTNVRFAQLVDGMDVQSPHIGSPIGNALGPSDLDIDQVEILPGVAASLYGMNAINGLADFSTRHAFEHQGLSVQQKLALSHVGAGEVPAKVFSETSLRFAKAWRNKWAVKTNFTYTQGYDWIASDYTDLNPNANESTGLLGSDNPAQDPVNGYGNESSNRRTLSLGGRNYVVARTGYLEGEVTAYALRNMKGDLTVAYKPTANSQLQYIFRGALLDNVYQRANRFRLTDYLIQQHAVQYQSKAVRANLYWNNENTGGSYNLRSMAENLDRAFKPDNLWYADYSRAFNTAAGNGIPAADAHRQARAAADAGRYQPGTAAYDAVLQKLAGINNWDSGAALRVRASFVQADLQWNLTESWLPSMKAKTGIEVLAGLDHRTFIIQPDGNYFINPVEKKEGEPFLYSKTGAFVSLNRNFIQQRLRIGAALRADKNDYFSLKWSPRFTAVYSPAIRHNFRASWQMGYRFPIIFEGFSNVNSGGVKRVGGLPVMSQGIFENAWLQSSIAVFQSAVLRDINAGGLSRDQAIGKNQGLLQKNPYSYLQPEQVRSLEFGYRGLFLGSRLLVDADLYFNNYRNFIAQANMNIPATAMADSIAYFLYDRNRQSPYRMWTNAQSAVYNYGFSLGLSYALPKGYNINGNTSFARLTRRETQDGLEDGFNTPAWMVNLSVSNPAVWKQLGAGITWRWQSSFYWQSFLVNGTVPAFGTLDAQMTWRWKKPAASLKMGGANLLNQYYRSFLGGPAAGAFFYCTITLDLGVL